MKPWRGPATRIAAYQVGDMMRSRWVIGYAVFFLCLTEALLRFGGDGERALVSLVDVVLFIVPLVTLTFGTMYCHNAREFLELVLAQPVRRRAVCAGLYAGLVLPLVAAFAAGIGIPFLLEGAGDAGTILLMLLTGGLLTASFGAIALLLAFRTEDRLRGLGLAVGIWAVTAVLYDGAVLLAAALLTDHAIEQPLLAAIVANPVDLARVVLLLRFDTSALLGYTGAVFHQFFGGSRGTLVAVAALFAWVLLPLVLATRRFDRRDF